jgi:hypothetical protein
MASVLLVLVVGDSVRELKTQDIISIEPITLKCIDYDGSLKSRLEVSKAQNNFLPGFFLSRDESHSFESEEGSKDVSNLSFSGVERNPLNINSVRCIFRDR